MTFISTHDNYCTVAATAICMYIVYIYIYHRVIILSRIRQYIKKEGKEIFKKKHTFND